MVQLLLHAQATVDATTVDGSTAMQMPSCTGHTAAVQVLSDAHAMVNVAGAADGSTAMHQGASAGRRFSKCTLQ